jgi:hypothetical protein
MVQYDYFEKSESFYCRLHKLSFKKGSKCPKCEVSSNVHKQSQVITSKSQEVLKRSYKRKVKNSVYERFHNYGLKFKAIVLWDYIFVEPINLNNHVQYKRLNFDLAIVKVFRKSILVTLRANQEVKGMNVRDAEKLSISKINVVLDLLPKSITISKAERDRVNVHNAFVNHPFAKRQVTVEVNNEVRFISDNSKGLSEFEAVNPKFAIVDSEAIELDTISLIDKGLSRDFLAQSINALIQDRKFWAEHQRSHVQAIQDLSKGVNEWREQIRKDRIKRFIDEYR